MDTLYSMNLPKTLHKFLDRIQNPLFPPRLWGGLAKGYHSATDPEFSMSPEPGVRLGGAFRGL